MKNLKNFVPLLILATTFTFCTVPSSNFDINKTISHQVYKSVIANENGDCIPFSISSTFDLKSNTEINKFYNRLVVLKIKSITWEIIDYNGDTGVFMNRGFIKLGSTSIPILEENLFAADTGNKEFVTTDPVILNAIAAEIKPSGAVELLVDTQSGGECENDFNFNFKITINVTATISVS